MEMEEDKAIQKAKEVLKEISKNETIEITDLIREKNNITYINASSLRNKFGWGDTVNGTQQIFINVSILCKMTQIVIYDIIIIYPCNSPINTKRQGVK